MQTNTAARPVKTALLLRSCSVRSAASWPAADFLRSATARFMPMPRLLRMRNSVKVAPTSIPPTATGRTMENQTAVATSAHPASPAPLGIVVASCGPRKKISSGTSRPQANTPPAKFKAPEPRSDDVPDAQISRADRRRRERRGAARREGRSVGAAAQLQGARAEFADAHQEILADAEQLDGAEEVDDRADAHVGEQQLGRARASLSRFVDLGRRHRLGEWQLGVFHHYAPEQRDEQNAERSADRHECDRLPVAVGDIEDRPDAGQHEGGNREHGSRGHGFADRPDGSRDILLEQRALHQAQYRHADHGRRVGGRDGHARPAIRGTCSPPRGSRS